MTIVDILSLQNTIPRLHAITIGWSPMTPIQTERVQGWVYKGWVRNAILGSKYTGTDWGFGPTHPRSRVNFKSPWVQKFVNRPGICNKHIISISAKHISTSFLIGSQSFVIYDPL
jgi:hypothetical protein